MKKKSKYVGKNPITGKPETQEQKDSRLMSSDYPKSFNRLINDNYDADDSDRLFQIACFGEVIYG